MELKIILFHIILLLQSLDLLFSTINIICLDVIAVNRPLNPFFSPLAENLLMIRRLLMINWMIPVQVQSQMDPPFPFTFPLAFQAIPIIPMTTFLMIVVSSIPPWNQRQHHQHQHRQQQRRLLLPLLRPCRLHRSRRLLFLLWGCIHLRGRSQCIQKRLKTLV